MLGSLIPFFLAVRMTVDENVWKYGPEYVFDIEMNVTLTPMNYVGIQISNYTVVSLFCRPTGIDGLYCHLEEIRQRSIINNNRIDLPEEQARLLISEEPFEIKFSENGIDYLTVNDQVEVKHLNNFKLIAEQLNIGVDLNGVPDGMFYATENTTIGECGVTVAINRYPSKRMMNGTRGSRYELEFIPRLNKLPNEDIMIEKNTDLNNCSYYPAFYFRSYGANIPVETDLDSHLESSTLRIFVDRLQFVSSMLRIGTLGTEKNKRSAMMQYINTSLRNIRAAERELSQIPNSSITSIAANSETKRIFSMK